MNRHVFVITTDYGIDSVWTSKEEARRRERAMKTPAAIVKFTLNCVAISGKTAIELPDN